MQVKPIKSLSMLAIAPNKPHPIVPTTVAIPTITREFMGKIVTCSKVAE
jgi:hypothetical protein